MKKILLISLLFLFAISPRIANSQDNYSLDFSSGDYGRIPMSETLSNFEEFTMEFWYFETGGHGSDENIVGTEYFGGSRYTVYSFVDGFWPFIADGNSGLGISYNGDNPLDGISYIMNEWQHLAISYDGFTFYFFLNGQVVYSQEGEIHRLELYGKTNEPIKYTKRI